MENNFNTQNDSSPSESQVFLGSEALGTLIAKLRDGSFQEIIDDWKWIFTYSRRYKWIIVYYTVLGLVSSSLSVLSALASKYLIDIITGYKTDQLIFLLVLMIGSSAFSLIINSILSRISLKISIFINNDIQSDIFDKIIDADWLSISQYSNGDVLNRFNSDIGTVSSNAVSWVPSIILNLYNFVITFIVIMYYDPIMAVIAFSSAPLMLIIGKLRLRKMRNYNKKVREMSSKLMSFEVETFYNFDTIKSFGVADHYRKGLKKWQNKYKDFSLEYNLFSIKTGALASVFGMLISMVSFCYCLYLLWTRQIAYGTMTLFLNQGSKLSSNFNSIISIIPSFLNSSVSAHRIRELVELPKEIHIPESSEMDQWANDGFEISMEDVDYAYVENNHVITKSAFTAKPGEIVALVGPSGEGKTTMIRLILGLIHPAQGHVHLVASNGAYIDMNADTRHLFSYVPQGNTILSGTIAENMRMVKEDASDEEIIEALQIACAWDFVKDLPDTINCKIGERGRGFSEGQSQRIAIARAVLRNSPILLLDEATSALDVTTERKVLRNIIQQRPNKTCIVTTHRPSVLNMCQRVYRVMETKVTPLSEEESSKMAIDF